MAFAATDLARFNRVRALLERERTVPAGLLPPVIAASWRRCLELGLDPQAVPRIERLQDLEIARHLDDAAEVLTLARDEMAELSRQLGTGDFVLAFAAPDGMVLETLVAPSRRRDLEAMGIAPGAVWRETMVGTNGLGTASATGSRITVRGPEHFFACHNRLTCIATPIFNPDRSLAGVLDASCPAERYAPRARAMVALAGASIETRLFRMQRAGARVVTFHGRAEFLETPYAGLLAIDASGRIDAANDQARFMLVGLGEPAGKDFDTVFATRVDRLMPGTVRRVTDSAGREFHLRLDGPPPARGGGMRGERRRPDRTGGSIVADDPAMAAALDLAVRAARRGLPILLQGETGTGKDATARATHAAVRRAAGLITVNSATLPLEADVAADLIAKANGGTLLLEEIADFSEVAQAALLRLLDEASLAPEDGASPAADILVIATTSADLPAAVVAGRFRRDLYHRIAVAEVRLPALRERDDFALLTEALLDGIAAETPIAPEAIARLAAEEWPGNIRELGNVLARLALVAPDGIGAEDVAEILAPPLDRSGSTGRQPGLRAGGDTAATLQEARTRQIEAVLREEGGNVSRAARRLGVSRNLIYRALGTGRRPPG